MLCARSIAREAEHEAQEAETTPRRVAERAGGGELRWGRPVQREDEICTCMRISKCTWQNLVAKFGPIPTKFGQI